MSASALECDGGGICGADALLNGLRTSGIAGIWNTHTAHRVEANPQRVGLGQEVDFLRGKEYGMGI